MEPNDNNQNLPPPQPDAAAQELAAKLARLDTAEASTAELRSTLAAERGQFLELARQANADVPAELIHGDTPADIRASIDTARAVVAKVLEANKVAAGNGHATPPKVPAGGTPATTDVASLPAIERITRGLAQLRGGA